MAQYVLRYFFDPRSGVCLWSANAEAREKFGYPVTLHSLSLSEEVRLKGELLLTWFDTSVNWSYPPGPSPWSEQEQARFQEESQAFLMMLRQCLGPDFEIHDESSPSEGTRSESAA